MTEATGPQSGAGHKLVSFRAAEQDFCVDIISVREIRGWTTATLLPHSPEYVRGVINLRGAIVPIVDLAARLGLGETQPKERSVIIILIMKRGVLGLLVDGVSDILSVSEEQIQPAPDCTQGGDVQFVRGVISLEDRMIRYLDITHLMPRELDGLDAA